MNVPALKVIILKRMKMKVNFLFIVMLFLGSVQAQSLQGFYTGQLKMSGIPERFNVQMDIMEDGKGLSAVFRTRIIDDRQLAGCDNWLQGAKSGNDLRFKSLVPLKITNIPDWICNEFATLTLQPKKLKEGTSSTEWIGNLYDGDGTNLGKVTLEKIDNENSFSVVDERDEARYMISEQKIYLATSDTARLRLILEGRGVHIIDSLAMDTTSSVLRIEAPGADAFHKLTVMVNEKVVLLNNSPAQKGTNIRLTKLEEGDLDIIFICYHFLVNTNFNVKLTLEYGGGMKTWEIPVTTYKNRGIRLKVRNDTSLPSGE
jgi:hypothetical protein